MFKVSSETKEFFNLNKKKIKNLYFVFCIISSFWFFIILLYISSGNFGLLFSLLLSLIGLIFSYILLPILFFSEYFFSFWKERKNTELIISQVPFDKLDTIGFQKRKVLKSTKEIKKFILTAEKDGFTLMFYPKSRNIAVFEIFCYMDKYPKWGEVLEFRSKGFRLDYGSILKEINIKKEKLSIQQLDSILREMIMLIKIKHYTPLSINEEGEY
jgi:hypothetical protein